MELVLLPLSLVCAWVAAAAALDRLGARRRASPSYDAIVVAGAAVRADGRPSDALLRRVGLAVELWRAGHAPTLVFTGGPSAGGHTESAVAARVAVAAGVPAGAVRIEELSHSTEGNAAHAREVLGGGRVIVVTDSYHVLRCELVFARYFDEAHGIGALPPGRARVRMALREVVVLGVYAVRGRLQTR